MSNQYVTSEEIDLLCRAICEIADGVPNGRGVAFARARVAAIENGTRDPDELLQKLFPKPRQYEVMPSPPPIDANRDRRPPVRVTTGRRFGRLGGNR